jgi:hypothetical protein
MDELMASPVSAYNQVDVCNPFELRDHFLAIEFRAAITCPRRHQPCQFERLRIPFRLHVVVFEARLQVERSRR